MDESDAPVVEFPQHIMNKLNLKMGTEIGFEILCTLNIPQKIDEVQFDYDVTNKMLSQTFEDSPHRSVTSDFLFLFLPLFPFDMGQWTESLKSLLSSHSPSFSISCELFPRFLMSSSAWLNCLLGDLTGLFPVD
jgi:hypothetical protein